MLPFSLVSINSCKPHDTFLEKKNKAFRDLPPVEKKKHCFFVPSLSFLENHKKKREQKKFEEKEKYF